MLMRRRGQQFLFNLAQQNRVKYESEALGSTIVNDIESRIWLNMKLEHISVSEQT